MSDGSELTCTKHHKFYIQNKYPTSLKQDIIKSKSVEIVEAQYLKPDMKLIKCEYPIINNKKELKSAYTNGFFSGDGTYSNGYEKNCNRHIDYQRNNETSDFCSGVSYRKKPHVSTNRIKSFKPKLINFSSLSYVKESLIRYRSLRSSVSFL